MKKIIAFLTKGSKIRNILIYVYRGLVVADAAFQAGFAALKIERPEDKVYAKLEGIPEYLETAAKAVRTILEWMGVDTRSVEEAVARDAALARGESVETAALREITTGIKQA